MISDPLPITHYPLPITHYPLPITHYPLPTLPGILLVDTPRNLRVVVVLLYRGC